VLRRRANVFRWTNLDNLAEVHHRDPVSDNACSSEVVGNEHHGHSEFPPHATEQIEHGRGQGNVERASRFVTKEHLGWHRDGPGECGSLTLAARELACLGMGNLLGQTDKCEGLPGTHGALGSGDTFASEPVANHLPDRQPGGQRCSSILEDHLGPTTSSELETPGIGRQKTGDYIEQCRFPAPALANKSNRFTTLDGQVDASQRLQAIAGPEPALHTEVLLNAHQVHC
jgi:hypothetical protein